MPTVHRLDAALVVAYLTERAETARISTVRVAAAAIDAAHRAGGADDPTGAASVRTVVAGITRQHAARPDAAPRQAAPLSLESGVQLMTLAQQPGGPDAASNAPSRCAASRTARSSLSFCAGPRRSEIAALRRVDVAATERPEQLRVRVRARRRTPSPRSLSLPARKNAP